MPFNITITNRNIRKVGGKLLRFLSSFDNMTATRKQQIFDFSAFPTGEIRNLCIFVSYATGKVEQLPREDQSTLEYLGFQVVHVKNVDNRIPNRENESHSTIQRLNRGMDLAAIRDVLKLVPNIPEKLLIINSSMHFLNNSLGLMITKAQNLELDVIGITDSYQTRYHLQSYFYYSETSKGVEGLLSEFSKMKNWKTKRAAVTHGELKITRNLIRKNLKVGAIVDYSNLKQTALENPDLLDKKVHADLLNGINLNPTQHFWLVLFYLKFPIIKKSLILKNPANLDFVPKNSSEAKEIYEGLHPS